MGFAFLQAAKETLKQKEENSNRLGQTECKVTIIMVIYRYLLLPFWICIWSCFLLSNHFSPLCITFVWYLVLKIYCVLWYCFVFHCILFTKGTIWLWFRKLGMLLWSCLPHKYSYKLFILSEHELVKTVAHLWLITYHTYELLSMSPFVTTLTLLHYTVSVVLVLISMQQLCVVDKVTIMTLKWMQHVLWYICVYICNFVSIWYRWLSTVKLTYQIFFWVIV